MYNTYKDKVEFLLVYIREAHPNSVLLTRTDPKSDSVLKKITQSNTVKERTENAKMCTATLKLSMPAVIDREDNKVNSVYAGWPDRLYVVGIDGAVAYMGGPGPRGFKTNEVKQWLQENVK